MRGKRELRNPPVTGLRSIPACAGETSARPLKVGAGWVYPRVCGGNQPLFPDTILRGGLSPRVRGKRGDGAGGNAVKGSIPACAGETSALTALTPPAQVYPRVCGGNGSCAGRPPHRSGLSPRVRGKPDIRAAAPSGGRSIPACAGETRCTICPARSCTVYPRVCGGNLRSQFGVFSDDGLSPRVRGKLGALAAPIMMGWSIPACAGETLNDRIHRNIRGVYPRVCGGNPACTGRRRSW